MDLFCILAVSCRLYDLGVDLNNVSGTEDVRSQLSDASDGLDTFCIVLYFVYN